MISWSAEASSTTAEAAGLAVWNRVEAKVAGHLIHYNSSSLKSSLEQAFLSENPLFLNHTLWESTNLYGWFSIVCSSWGLNQSHCQTTQIQKDLFNTLHLSSVVILLLKYKMPPLHKKQLQGTQWPAKWRLLDGHPMSRSLSKYEGDWTRLMAPGTKTKYLMGAELMNKGSFWSPLKMRCKVCKKKLVEEKPPIHYNISVIWLNEIKWKLKESQTVRFPQKRSLIICALTSNCG